MAEEKTASVKDFFNTLAIDCGVTSTFNDWDFSPDVKDIISQLSPETLKRYLGSGLTIPEHIEGKRILDIGCGGGSLVFILSKLVGPLGSVVGTDLSSNYIEECKKQEEYHRKKWGYDKKNTEFFVGNAEDLKELKDKDFDVVVSSGLICVVPNKEKAFAEAYRVLKDGGEFRLSDVYGSMKPPEDLMNELKLWNIGIIGCQMVEELHSSVQKAGFTTPYLTFAGPMEMIEEFKGRLPGRRYCGAGNRMFRLGGAARRGPASVTYKGNVKGYESEFKWDVNLTFKAGQAVTVDGDLATILANTRYRDVFDIADASGSPPTHRAQNPFSHLDKLKTQGIIIPQINPMA